ncbi:MAG TPA: AAA family ATPase [Candidatus Rubrimentiphilum sp.]|nr:AAA family ATPase [Candidatus Rubrimentiphilum sp.]
MSTAAPLKSLIITAFRGSSTTFTLHFEKARKLTLIYGENGTGKTTICDAFELLARERVSSLEGYGLGQGLEKYWPTTGKSLADLSVALESSSGTCSGKMIGRDVSVSPVALRPRIELLRRQQMLDLIKAEPAKRYDAIKRFIDIATFETSEEALSKQTKSLREECTAAAQAEGQSLQELQGFYEAAGEPTGLNAVTWAKQRIAEPMTDLDGDIAAVGKLRVAFDTLASFPEKAKSRQKVLEKATEALARADKALLAAAKAATGTAADTLELLEAGSKYLHAHPGVVECPLCRSQENAAGLADALAARLADLDVLRLATGKRQQCAIALTAAQTAVTQLNSDYVDAVSSYQRAVGSHAWKADVVLPINAPSAEPQSVSTWLEDNKTTAQSWPAVESSWRGEKKFVQSLSAANDRYEQNLSTRAQLATLVPKLEEALKHCIEQRQVFTNKIIGEIAQEVGKLYEQVHPGEGLDKIALPLDPKKRASIELEARFLGKEAPPQAYFSQSHLDTLGLCVFLALAARERPDETVLILDDVLGSADEPHVERVVGMVYEVSEKFCHTLVTTHYRPWRERFRWGSLKPGRPCQFVELTQWSISDGISLVGCLPEIDLLKGLLAQTPPDTQSICGKAGVILEYALDYLTLRYECRLPRRYGNPYTLGELLDAIDKKLREALHVEIRDGLTDSKAAATKDIPLKPILDELSSIAQVRNAVGAHFKTISFDLPDQDAIGFARLVVQLVDALSHPDHGWPTNDNSGSFWRNNGDSRRLHPLKKPS